MSTMEEIQAAIPKLTLNEVERIREWIDDFLEDRLELSDEAAAKIEQSREDIARGEFITRR